MSDTDWINIDIHAVADHLAKMWPTTFEGATYRRLLVSNLRPLEEADGMEWTFPQGDKRIPYTRFEQTYGTFGIKKINGKWEIGLNQWLATWGVRIQKQSSGTGRWGSAGKELRDAFVMHLASLPSPYVPEGYEFLVNDPETGEATRMRIASIKGEETRDKLTFRTIPEILQAWHGIDATTKKMQEFCAHLEEIRLRHAPIPVNIIWLEGKQITDAYTKSVGGHSCMVGPANAYLTEMYALNPDRVKLVTNKERNIRTLVWIVRPPGSPEVWYVDRGYPPGHPTDAKFKVSVEEEAKRVGAIARFPREWEGDMSPWIKDGTAPVFIMNLPMKRIVPYMDTLVYGALITPLPDGTPRAVFARTKALIPYSQVYNAGGAKYPDTCPAHGIELISPVITPRQTGGGMWRTSLYKCQTDDCKVMLESFTIEDIRAGRDPSNHVSNQTICPVCLAEKYVKTWHPMGPDKGTLADRRKCVWSENLKAWVNPTSPYTTKYLVLEGGDYKRAEPQPTNNPYEVNVRFIKALDEAARRMV